MQPQQTSTVAVPKYEAPDDELRDIKQEQGTHGVMFGGDYNWPVERQVTEAYGDTTANPDTPLNSDRRSLAFHTELLPIPEAKQAVRAGPDRYNSYNREHVVAFLDALPDYISTNRVRVSFGREGSPVLYVWLAGRDSDSAVANAADAAFGHYTDSYEARDGETKHRTVSSRPDEYSVLRPGDGMSHYGWQVPETADGVLVRMWWD